MKFKETVNDEGIVLIPIRGSRVIRGRRKSDYTNSPNRPFDHQEYYRLLSLQNDTNDALSK
jgi:hypothetical protein